MNFIAIDFETAMPQGQYICAYGLVKCVDGKIVETLESLVYPPNGRIDYRFTRIHGITESMVIGKGEFPAHIPQLKQFIGTMPLVAHCASFADKAFLHQTLQYYQLPFWKNRWGCSRDMARKLFRLENFKLDTVADHLGIQFNHHNALADASVSAQIALIANQR